MYKVTFTATCHDEFMTYRECIEFFGRERFKDVLKGLSSQATSYPVEDYELEEAA
jgi:hypothetical protein